MSNYVKTTDFAVKDGLVTGNPAKKAQGTQVDTEFNNLATAIATKEDLSNKATNNGYASLDSSGDVPDAQIPATIPRLNLNNVFSSSQTLQTGAAVDLIISSTGAAANEVIYRIRNNGGGQLQIQAVNDALSVANNIIVVDRTGATVDSVAITGTVVTVNGGTSWHSGNDGAGSGLDADLLDGQSSAFYQDAGNLNAGTLANARVAAGNVTQHQASINIAGAQVNSGTLPDARIQASGVTQHQASLSVAASQLTGSMPDARIVASNVTQHNASISGKNISAKTGITKTLSTSAASGGADGDIWYKY